MARISIRQLFRSRNTIATFSSSSFEDKSVPVCTPNLTFLQTCQNLRQLLQIQAHLIISGIFQNPNLASRIVKYSLDYGDIDYTVLIFRCIDSPTTICVNDVVKGYSITSNPHQALEFYFEMLRYGFVPNSFTFVPLVGSCAKLGCVGLGKKCHGQAFKNGVDSVLPVQNSLIHMYGCCGATELAMKVFGEMPHRDRVSWNSIIHVNATAGDLVVAHRVFDAMPEKNVVSWNVMINGYLKGGNPGCGLKLFREMVKKGLRGSETTMVSVLTACGRSARLKEGRSVHGSLIKTFPKSSVILDTGLIDMYSKCKRVQVACRVFDMVNNRNLVCWNAMILGHCTHGYPNDGLALFAEMVKLKAGHGTVHPDEITFIGVLCACARAGLLNEGKNYFSQMTDLFGILPNFAHLWCMANLYAGLGLLQEAVEVLRNLPEGSEDITSQSLLWASLLSSCRFQQGYSWGEQIAKYLIDMEPQNVSHYRLLLNVYAVAGRWEDVAQTKELMKKIRLGRLPGCNLIDLKKIVHCVPSGK